MSEANTEHPKLVAMRKEQAELAKRAAKAKADDFESVDIRGEQWGLNKKKGDSLAGVYLGSDEFGRYTFHKFGVAEGDAVKVYSILGGRVLNSLLAKVIPGKAAVRVTYDGSKELESGQTMHLWTVATL